MDIKRVALDETIVITVVTWITKVKSKKNKRKMPWRPLKDLEKGCA
jgi:hypothetical protein